MNELCSLLTRHCRDGWTTTAIPRLILSRSAAASEVSAAMYYPLFCVVAQGRKKLWLGEEEFQYDPTSYVVASVDLPVIGQVIEGPCLGFTLALEPAMLATLLLEMPPEVTDSASPGRALTVNPLDPGLLEPCLRLLRLLDKPADIPVLAPLAEREILYRLLLGPRGEMLRQMALPTSRLSQVRRAIQAIQDRYDQPMRVDELARLAGMSPPSLHRHFRAATSLSPLQFQKRLRLHEARRRLMAHDADAASVAFDVGYESASQFSREYRRLFGAPPGRDAAQRRQAVAAA